MKKVLRSFILLIVMILSLTLVACEEKKEEPTDTSLHLSTLDGNAFSYSGDYICYTNETMGSDYETVINNLDKIDYSISSYCVYGELYKICYLCPVCNKTFIPGNAKWQSDEFKQMFKDFSKTYYY